VFVAVKGHGLAVMAQVACSGIHVVKGRLHLDEAQLHQLPGGVVDVDQQAAFVIPVLKPPFPRRQGARASA